MLGGLTGAITKVVCFALVCLPCIYVAQNQAAQLADLEKLGSGSPHYGPRLSQPESLDRRPPTLEVRALALFYHHRLDNVGSVGRVLSETGLIHAF